MSKPTPASFADIFGHLQFDTSGSDYWRRDLRWRGERSVVEVRDAKTRLAPTSDTSRYHTTLINPDAPPYDPKDATREPTVFVLPDASARDTIALAIGEANLLVTHDGHDMPAEFWMFEADDYTAHQDDDDDEESAERMWVYSAFFDLHASDYYARLSPGREFWILADPAGNYELDYVKWIGAVFEALVTGKAPPLLPTPQDGANSVHGAH